jgi:hypothetical protein
VQQGNVAKIRSGVCISAITLKKGIARSDPLVLAKGSSAPPATKPFSPCREVFRKQSRPRLPVDQTTGSIMLAAFLNLIYRQYLRTSLAGTKIAGRLMATP